ncbi:MAG: family 78 glycoside hydrolase catalytic domain [Phycisphaeraceae bacterium]
MNTPSPVTVEHLTCESAHHPLGLQTRHPRFGWQWEHTTRGQRQRAYQVRVASSPELLESGQADLWDSGQVASNEQCQVVYAGVPLHSRQQCWWTVRVWDDDGQASAWATPRWFELALLGDDDWHAEWLGQPAGWSGRAIYFRCPVKVDKPVRRARAYVAGLGCHELRINGRKVGDSVLDPATTVYIERVLYATHDVTKHLHAGANVVGVIVGNGWYGMPRLRLQMHIDFDDGTTQCVSTQRADGPGWNIAVGGVVHHGLYDGETHDARLEDEGWDTAAYDDHKAAKFAADQRREGRVMRWTMASAVDAPGGRMTAQSLEPMRVVQTLPARKVTQPRPGVWVLDFGTNMAGWARLQVQGERGTKVTLCFAETLRDDGTINQDNLYIADACDTYILKGGDEPEMYEPRFTYHGFRYVQVEGLPVEPDERTVQARVVRSDVARRGTFACSDERLTRIHRMVVQTEASNLHGIPTDCPQRAERMGWLNDMTARSEQAALNFDMTRFYSKFVDDIGDAQSPAGELPDTVPFRWGYRRADPVAIGYLMIPWLLHRHSGDKRLLERHYEGMIAWVECLASLAPEGILELSRWGDWSEPSGDPTKIVPPVSKRTPGTLVSTAFLAQHLRLLARIAGVLDKGKDAKEYAARADAIAEAFNRRFWDASHGVYGSGSQACSAIALAFDLVPADRVERVVQHLAADVIAHDCHLSTGNIATKYLLEVLSAHGRHDLACALAMQTTYPSWGFMLDHGATTLWERWEHATGGGMNSHNHPMLGSVGSWFYKHLAGIDVADDGVACDRLAFRPQPAPSIEHAHAELKTVRGVASLAWRQAGEQLQVTARVPFGATATLTLPWRERGAAAVLTEGDATLWPTTSAVRPDGVQAVEAEVDCVQVTLGGGHYDFQLASRDAASAPLDEESTRA